MPRVPVCQIPAPSRPVVPKAKPNTVGEGFSGHLVNWAGTDQLPLMVPGFLKELWL